MRKIIKAVALIIVAACIFPLAAACKRDAGGKKVDPNKTQLYVGFYEGGWGSAWMDVMIEEFERLNPKWQVFATGKKADYTNENLLSSIELLNNDMYFTTISPHDMVSEDKLMDITDVVTTPLTEYGETMSIVDKMDPYMQMYMKSTNTDGNYYTIPMYTSFYYIVYDVDLFEEEELYIAADGTFTDGKSPNKAKSVGQDGIEGNYDDGLPITWDDYKRMLGRMTMKGITPFIWSGDTPSYRFDMLTSMWANYQGAESFNLNFTFNGNDASLGGLEINETNGYELQKQPGKKYALDFAEYVVRNDMYHRDSFQLSMLYTKAQEEFLYSKRKEEEGKAARIAMLIDGGWWENEAKSTIDEMADLYKKDYIGRRFGLMPFPKFDENASPHDTLYSVTTNSTVFIRKNAKQPEIAKEFLRFTTSEENLRLYNRMTGANRPYQYSLTDDDLSTMSNFKQSLWDVFRKDTTRIVYAHGYSNLAVKNQVYFRDSWSFTAEIGTTIVKEPFAAFRLNNNLTSQQYFNTLYNYHRAQWSSLNR